MRKILNKLISKIKGEKYEIDEAISISTMFGLIWTKGMMVLRGILRKPFFQ